MRGKLLISGIKISPVLDCIKITVEEENFSALNHIFNTFGAKKINIWFEVQIKNRNNLVNVTLCIDPHNYEKVADIIRENYPNLNVCFIRSVNILSAFPYRENPEIASLFFKTLEEKGLSVIGVSTSLSSISCLIKHEQCLIAKESLKKAFGLRETPKPKPVKSKE